MLHHTKTLLPHRKPLLLALAALLAIVIVFAIGIVVTSRDLRADFDTIVNKVRASKLVVIQHELNGITDERISIRELSKFHQIAGSLSFPSNVTAQAINVELSYPERYTIVIYDNQERTITLQFYPPRTLVFSSNDHREFDYNVDLSSDRLIEFCRSLKSKK